MMMKFLLNHFRTMMLQKTRRVMSTAVAGTRNLSILTQGDYKAVNGLYINGIKNLSVRSNIPTFQMDAPRFLDFKRNICNIDSFTKNFNESSHRKRVGNLENVSEIRENIEAKFRESGIDKLFYEDLENLLLMAENQTHLEIVANVSQAFFEDSYRLDASQKTAIVTKFIYTCYNLNEIEMAKHLWNQSYIDLHRGKWLSIFYYSWLFDNGNYKEIVDDYSRISDEAKVNYEPLSLVIVAALAKIETKEAFQQMCDIQDKVSSTVKDRSRTYVLCSWVAYKLGNLGLAYDILTRPNVKSSGWLIDNMKLALLIEVNKINEATILLRTMLKNANDYPRQRGIRLCHDTMKKYTDSLRTTNEEELKKDAINICQELDAKADIVESSLEDMIFTRIRLRKEFDKEFHNKRETSRDRNTMRENVHVTEENPRKKEFKTSGLPYN